MWQVIIIAWCSRICPRNRHGTSIAKLRKKYPTHNQCASRSSPRPRRRRPPESRRPPPQRPRLLHPRRQRSRFRRWVRETISETWKQGVMCSTKSLFFLYLGNYSREGNTRSLCISLNGYSQKRVEDANPFSFLPWWKREWIETDMFHSINILSECFWVTLHLRGSCERETNFRRQLISSSRSSFPTGSRVRTRRRVLRRVWRWE